MSGFDIKDSKKIFDKHMALLESGVEKEVYLFRNGKKVAKIVLVNEEFSKKRLGAAIGILPDLPEGFDDPKLDEEIANDFDL